MAAPSYSVVIPARDAERTLPRVLEAVAALLAFAEWTLGASAFRYALRRPPITGGARPKFA